MSTLLAARFSRRSLLLFFPILLALAGSSFGVPSAFAFGAVTQSECTAQGGACQNAFCNLSTQIDVGPCVTPGLPNGQECCKAQGAGGACPGGTCRSGSCQAGESAFGACLVGGVSGGICCMFGGAVNAANQQNITFSNPLKFETVEGVLNQILNTLRGIIVILSLVFIVIGAVLYITSAGNEGRMTTAKNAILAAMIGLAIGLAAPSFLKEIGNVLGWGAVNNGAVAGARTLSEIATSVLNFLLSIVGVLAIIMLVVGGIMYLTAAGDEDRIDTGKSIVKWSIVGIAIALAALVIVSQIAAFFA